MLLTLAVRSLRRLLSENGSGTLTLLDTPDFVMRQLQLRGLSVSASMLAGWSLPDLDRLRDRADKAGCPCLLLVDDSPLPIADPDPAVRAEAADRIGRLATAAHRLGCSALGVHCQCQESDQALAAAVEQIRTALRPVERLELTLLLAPHPGLTGSPDRLAALIKRIGGFRIGSLPDFAYAAACPDDGENGGFTSVLRKLAPYAGAVYATIQGFSRKGEHKGYDLAEGVRALLSVGFLNTLAIDYVGADDPVSNIEKARAILQTAIDQQNA
jgi:sugar phosphate isomerase/epimerase